MKVKDEFTHLSNGYLMPKVAFGTYGIGKDVVTSVIMDALEAGYRHLETAPIYLNEKGIGEAIRSSGIDRNSLFITAKIPPHVKTYEGSLRMARRSMEKLGVDHLDLLLINNPVPWGKEGEDYSEENRAVWRAMETLYKEEVVGAIGVSNFRRTDIEALTETAEVTPHVNQVGIFAGHTLDDLRAYCEEKGITVQGHSPLARGRLLKQTWLEPLAKKEGMSVAQMLLRFVYELGVMPVVKSKDRKRMQDNLAIDRPLSKDTFKRLKTFEEDVRDYRPPGAKSIL